LVVEEDREKTTFITPWETYAYARMPFGLKNVGATFQRDMDHAFEGLIGKFCWNCFFTDSVDLSLMASTVVMLA
jgi:hypothetical protein